LAAEDLFALDQLHGRGVTATADHVAHAGIKPGMHMLEIGCGVGGASRYLVANIDCRITAIDLTEEYVEAARSLAERCGLDARIEYRQANALSLPFAEASFDHVWCHNVTMNIADKTGLAREIHRMLKPGGRYSCAEINLGPSGAPFFPLPWAVDASSSFLVTPGEMKSALQAGGLRVVENIDLTEANLGFGRDMKARADRGEPPRQTNHVVMGDAFIERVQNSAKCVVGGHLVENLIIAEKPPG
ncbi:MAG: methyltransferase domain-containing protein, partial [Rhodospirillales bacterium]|nr:methyltransferase domain-containing protein [Rhodospirillales bacterium]